MNRAFQITRRATLIGGVGAMAGVTAAGRAAEMEAGEIDTVATVTGGETFSLTSGLRVKLAGISAPRRPAPWGREARDGLAGLLRARRVQLSYGGDPRDRYDRALAQVHTLTPDGAHDLWVQEEMIRLGLARVYTWPDEQIDHEPLYRAEREARARGRGIWSHEAYAVRGPEPNALAQHVDSLQLVEGIVTSTADVRGRAYLNFGADYRTDFTIAVAKKHRRRFALYDPVSLEGARVRVRGWVELINGPMIWVSHPARLEILN